MDPEVTGTADAIEPNDPQETAETTAPAPGATDPTPTDTPAKVESFINPADLPDELKPHWSRMHSAYTKAQNANRDGKADIDFMTRYRTDPAYARQVVEQEARRLGVTMGSQPASQSNGTPPATTSTTEGVPAELVRAIEDQLPPELKWMAPAQAAASWHATKAMVAPILQKDQIRERTAYAEKVNTARAELDGVAPGWIDDNKTDIHELLTFLSDDTQLHHPKFGNKFAVIHNVLTGGARATANAAERMAAAARNRSTTGQSSRPVTANVSEQVAKARNNSEAIALASKAAIESLRAQGVALPDH